MIYTMMEWVFIIGVSAICFGIIYYLNVSKKKKLMAEDKIIDRDLGFFKKEYIGGFFMMSSSLLLTLFSPA